MTAGSPPARVRVLSDLHLGHKVSRVERVAVLRPLVEGADRVIFNGDTWQELAVSYRERALEMLEELKALCAEEGCEPVFLSGNHDPGWDQGWIELAQGKIVITHGDTLLYDSSPWKREVLQNRERVRELWAEHPRAAEEVEERIRVARRIAQELRSRHHPEGKTFWQRAWDAVLPPQRAWKMIDAWRSQGTCGAAFCERYFPQAEFLIIGHFHWEGCWRRRGRTILNTGSFMSPGKAQCVEFSGGMLTRRAIEEKGGTCRLGKPLGQWSVQGG